MNRPPRFQKPFDPRAAFELADRTLAAPPARPHIRRAKPQGALVARFVLPLELCQPENRGGHAQPWKFQRQRRDAFLLMLSQHGQVETTPLQGRPMVRCIRFSSAESDPLAGWAKNPVDRLCPSKTTLRKQRLGLGLIRDDRGSAIDLVQWWEPAPPGQGCVLVEVWTGRSA